MVAIVFGLIGIGLWLWMAWANKAGKNWARITATVFFALDTLSVLAGFRQAEPALSRAVSLLVWLAGLGAIVLLWQKISSAYFAASRTGRSPGPCWPARAGGPLGAAPPLLRRSDLGRGRGPLLRPGDRRQRRA